MCSSPLSPCTSRTLLVWTVRAAPSSSHCASQVGLYIPEVLNWCYRSTKRLMLDIIVLYRNYISSIWQLFTCAVSWSSLHIYYNTDFPLTPVLSLWKTPWSEMVQVLESTVGCQWPWPPTSHGTNMTFVPWPPPSFPRPPSMNVRA